jgi:hypothetical protein
MSLQIGRFLGLGLKNHCFSFSFNFPLIDFKLGDDFLEVVPLLSCSMLTKFRGSWWRFCHKLEDWSERRFFGAAGTRLADSPRSIPGLSGSRGWAQRSFDSAHCLFTDSPPAASGQSAIRCLASPDWFSLSVFSGFLPADSPGLDRGQSASVHRIVSRTSSILFVFWDLNSGQPAPMSRTVRCCVMWLGQSPLSVRRVPPDSPPGWPRQSKSCPTDSPPPGSGQSGTTQRKLFLLVSLKFCLLWVFSSVFNTSCEVSCYVLARVSHGFGVTCFLGS